MNLAGKKVTVVGLGLHGGALGTIAWLHKLGAVITVTDVKTKEQLAATIEKLHAYPNITLILGEHRAEDFTTADLIVRNPAVPRNSDYLQMARAAGIPIEMDSSLFFQHASTGDIIGITGSKGKTTTAHAIAAMMHVVNGKTVAVGIDGVSPLGELPKVTPDTPVVFELSSWRLEALGERNLSPATAVVTSIYRDHLNTYASFEEYIETKKIIVKYQSLQDAAILNYDDEHLRQWTRDIKGKLFWYSIGPVPKGNGIYIENKNIVVKNNGQAETLFSVHDLPPRPEHELRNLLPAMLIGYQRGLAAKKIKKVIQELPRLRHRLEIVREVNSVTYVNDSAATMPDATIAAVRAYTGKPLVAIMGGSDKALLFDELAQELTKASLKAIVFLPGTATARMKEAIQERISSETPLYEVANMHEAVQKAHQVATKGDTVLLSPGATSFGLFQHEFDRGDQFCSEVNNL